MLVPMNPAFCFPHCGVTIIVRVCRILTFLPIHQDIDKKSSAV
uniref:Uncharacterized protein n=1 Tax=Candidatus Kentrum sp. LPFa TaxID=2126335 RepID=A0A450WGJ2_9GAMM|nr:MAG: hypothetical protein BECKLPF1236A_GA0070988_1013919 [Candidatus Kentron sp. LPFa]VFK31873.1 MAG: hypothetical protein BECKLPF1236C_GA0070990_1015019 [Candidatus Kentron sp. LPFa]